MSAFFKRNKSPVAYVIFGVLMMFVPLLLNATWTGIFQKTFFYAFASMGMLILLGYTGLASLGTAGFIGIGSFAYAWMSWLPIFNKPFGFILAIISAMAAAVIIGLVVGVFASRVEGFYLAIATMAFADVLRHLFTEFIIWTHVNDGMALKEAKMPDVGLDGTFSDAAKLRLFAIIMVVVMYLMFRLTKSYFGRAFLTMKESEPASKSMGINLFRYRLLSFSIYAALSGLAGSVFVMVARGYSYNFTLFMSLSVIGIVVVGGMLSIPGVLFGSLVIFGIPEILKDYIPINGFGNLFAGLVMVLVVMFYPGGLAQVYYKIKLLIYKAKKNSASNRVKEVSNG